MTFPELVQWGDSVRQRAAEIRDEFESVLLWLKAADLLRRDVNRARRDLLAPTPAATTPAIRR